MKTIKMSKNLFSLTERLPKSKYQQSLGRDASQDSVFLPSAVQLVSPQVLNSIKLKSVGNE